jgi:crotonobetainyl-CoA:carnitine CoA-transferase CaiB-like acyl-CoA transferase
MVISQLHEAAMPPLEGVRILDLSLQLPGPYATWLLQALGAEVISIEPPGGDPVRRLDPDMHATLSEGKTQRRLDLRSADGVEALRCLVAESQVFMEGFRPGVVERLGFGFEQVSALRPDVVYCSISGYGHEGPYRDVAGHDLNYLGVAGAADLHGGASGPRAQGLPLVDLAAGTTAALAVLAGLRRLERTGEGCYLDLAMLDCAVAWANVKKLSGLPEAAYGIFEAADGLFLSLGVLEDKFWHALCDTMGWQEWRTDSTLLNPSDRQLRATEIDERLRTQIAERPREEWLRRFAEADVPAAPAHAGDDVASDPQVRARELLIGDRPRVPLPPVLTRPLGQAPLRAGGE